MKALFSTLPLAFRAWLIAARLHRAIGDDPTKQVTIIVDVESASATSPGPTA